MPKGAYALPRRMAFTAHYSENNLFNSRGSLGRGPFSSRPRLESKLLFMLLLICLLQAHRKRGDLKAGKMMILHDEFTFPDWLILTFPLIVLPEDTQNVDVCVLGTPFRMSVS